MTFQRLFAALAVAGLSLAPAMAAELGDDGLHKQPFFAETFLELADDLAEATAAGKDLMILVEQNGCPYCRELHEVNFARPELAAYAAENFLVVQLDMWGARDVTDFDGETLEERDLMRKWGLSFTPTTVLFASAEGAPPPADWAEARAFLMPGYFKPFHHLSAMEYVATDGYLEEPNFQRWLQAKAERMREEGHEVDIWN